jgi:hypothetical protein
MSFYVTLNSSAEGEFMKQNNASCFKVHFGQVLDFEGEWEVALVEIKFPMTISNINRSSSRIISTNMDDSILFDQLSERDYGTAADLIAHLNKRFKGRLKISLDKSNIVHFEMSKTEEPTIYFVQDELKDILGLKRSDTIGENEYLSGTYPVNLNKSLPSVIYVNSSIVKQQLIDNSHMPLLRIVPTSAAQFKYGFDKVLNFPRPQYKALASRRLEYIDVYITDCFGEQVSFDYGSSSVLLHFRRAPLC